MNLSLSRSDVPIAWPALTGTPPSASVPAAGCVTSFTFTSTSSESVSVKAKSPGPNGYDVSSSIVTVRSADAGSAFGDTGAPAGYAALVSASTLPPRSVKLTRTFSFLPASAATTR